MTGYQDTIRRMLVGTSLVALLMESGPALAQFVNANEVVTTKDIVDMRPTVDKLEAWRKSEHERLRREGRATADEFRKIDDQVLEKARAAEIERTQALDKLSKKSGGVQIGQGSGGTDPLKGRGALGDVDTRSMSGPEYDKVLKAARESGYTITQKGDGFTIHEIDTTVHRAPASETKYGSSEQSGSSGRAAEIARGNNPETAMGLGKDDPAISVSDNLKKASHTLSTPPGELSPADLQKLGKMTGRNMDAVEAVARNNGQPVSNAATDSKLRQQADMLKQGYSPEAAGIVRENATPEQKAQDLGDFQRRSREATVEAVKAADNHAGKQMDRLAGEARHANEVLDATQKTGDPERIERAKAKALEAEKNLVDYQAERSAAHEAAVVNEPEAQKIVSEARGVKTEGQTPSQVREAIVGPERKATVSTVSEPVKAPGSATAAEGAGPKGMTGSTVMKGANAALGAYAVYEGVKRGAAEAGKEAAEGGDGAVKSAAKTVGYSAWYGLGIGGALETGKRAGEESAQKWADDVKAGKVDPTSKLSQYWAQARAVGWGLAEFTGLQAIKDATVEGAGAIKDRYTQYQAEKAATEQAAANADRSAQRGDKPADKATDKPADKGADKPVTTAVPEKGKDGDAKAADAKSPDTKPVDTKAGDKPAATDKADAAGSKDGATVSKDGAAAPKDGDGKTAPSGRATKGDGAADKTGAETAKTPADGKAPVVGTQPKPVQPVVVPVPVPPPPPPTTTEVEGGWLQDKNGKTKVVYINDAKGNRIGGYYVHYNAQGIETGRETFTETPQTPNASLDGNYAGRISGGSSGALRITVQGGRVSGTIGGVHQGDPISATFAASLSADGSFSAPASGTLRTTSSDGKVYSYGFTGNVSGRVNGTTGAGSWSGGNTWGQSKGTWQAGK